MTTGFRPWFMALIAAAGAVSLWRNFGGADGALGLALGTIAPLVCVAAALTVVVFAARSRRKTP